MESIANSICQQLIALQTNIAARDEGQRFPTNQEVSIQCRLINCLDKLQKMAAKSGLQLSELSREDITDSRLATQIDKLTTTTAVRPEPAPITEQDFREYGHLLGTFRITKDNNTTRFRGRFVNTRWLEYNLFQYCLPPAERRFIGDARKVVAEVNYAQLQQQIKAYKEGLQATAA